ncbi:putative acyl-CoA dehydrogenase YdbM [Arthrobacter sp. Hiyo8]|nr:putative acyl-CoA dehydrogenase YdbM [Arthrobacter sp. Hiyo8]
MTPEEILPDEMLRRIRDRAAGYDQNNSFFHEDLEELAAAGYLKIFVPESDGGLGLGLEAAAALQRRLATAAPATALAVNMHLVWTGVAHVLARRGDGSLDFVLKESGHGEVFAFGISEPGNDSMLFDSGTTAEPQLDGGYSFTGRKIFTSLSPAWTRLGIFGKDGGAREGSGELVFGFIQRDAPGHETLNDWDTLGMRASQSNTTLLHGAMVPPERIFRKLPVGPNQDPLIFAIFACFETLLAAVYTGIAERAFTLAVEAVKRRTSAKYGAEAFRRTRTSAGRLPTPPWQWIPSSRIWRRWPVTWMPWSITGRSGFPSSWGSKCGPRRTPGPSWTWRYEFREAPATSGAPNSNGCTAMCWPGSSIPPMRNPRTPQLPTRGLVRSKAETLEHWSGDPEITAVLLTRCAVR